MSHVTTSHVANVTELQQAERDLWKRFHAGEFDIDPQLSAETTRQLDQLHLRIGEFLELCDPHSYPIHVIQYDDAGNEVDTPKGQDVYRAPTVDECHEFNVCLKYCFDMRVDCRGNMPLNLAAKLREQAQRFIDAAEACEEYAPEA